MFKLYQFWSFSVIFNFSFMVLSVLSVCMTVLVLNIHHMGPLPDIPPWVYTVFFTLRKKHHKQQKNKMEDSCITVQPAHECVADTCSDERLDRSGFEKKAEKIEVQEKWKDIASIINKGFFYIFLFVFFLLMIICSSLWVQS